MPEPTQPKTPDSPTDGAPADGGDRLPVESLVDRARSGDETAARRLFDRYRDSVMGYCTLSTDGDRDRAKDLVQQSFITVFERLDDLEDPSAFTSWLWTIVRRTCADDGSRRSRHGEILEMFELNRDVVLGHDEKHLRERRIECVHDILETVDDEQLERIVEMKYTEPEHTTREIADELEMPHGTVTVKLMRFREAIEQELADKLEAIDAPLTPGEAGR